MAETAIIERTEASAFAGLFLPASDGIARVSEAPAMTRLSLRVLEDNRASLASALGLVLPERINTAGETSERAALRLGPDEWLIFAQAGAARALANDAARMDRAVPHALVEISARNAGLVLEGPAVEDVLSAGCPLPLDIARFPVGRATRTLFAKAEIVLWRRAPDRFHLEFTRSFAPYVVGLLAEVIGQEAAIRRADGSQSGQTQVF